VVLCRRDSSEPISLGFRFKFPVGTYILFEFRDIFIAYFDFLENDF
jgi:hypothetical protein